MLASIHNAPHSTQDADPFRIPMKCLGAALGVAPVALLAVLLDVQVLHADEFVARPFGLGDPLRVEGLPDQTTVAERDRDEDARFDVGDRRDRERRRRTGRD